MTDQATPLFSQIIDFRGFQYEQNEVRPKFDETDCIKNYRKIDISTVCHSIFDATKNLDDDGRSTLQISKASFKVATKSRSCQKNEAIEKV